MCWTGLGYGILWYKGESWIFFLNAYLTPARQKHWFSETRTESPGWKYSALGHTWSVLLALLWVGSTCCPLYWDSNQLQTTTSVGQWFCLVYTFIFFFFLSIFFLFMCCKNNTMSKMFNFKDCWKSEHATCSSAPTYALLFNYTLQSKQLKSYKT